MGEDKQDDTMPERLVVKYGNKLNEQGIDTPTKGAGVKASKNLRERAKLGDITNRNLDDGRPLGAKANKEKAETKHGQWRQMGKEYLKAKPYLSVDDAINYVWSRSGEKGKQGGCKRSTVATVLKGIKKEVTNELTKE